jgi:hypothetical protein
MKNSIYILAFLSVFGFFGCGGLALEETISIPKEKTFTVVLGELNPDSTLKVRLSYSKSKFSNQIGYTSNTNCQVQLFENGQLFGVLTYNPISMLYEMDKNPNWGKTYKIEVKDLKNGDILTAQTRVPLSKPEVSVLVEDYNKESFGVINPKKYKLKITDKDPNILNFYVIQLSTVIQKGNSPIFFSYLEPFESNNPNLTDIYGGYNLMGSSQEYYPNAYLIDKKLDQGEFLVEFIGSYKYQKDENDPEHLNEFPLITVSMIDNNYLDFVSSDKTQPEGDLFDNPKNIKSNVKGGLGAFSFKTNQYLFPKQ